MIMRLSHQHMTTVVLPSFSRNFTRPHFIHCVSYNDSCLFPLPHTNTSRIYHRRRNVSASCIKAETHRACLLLTVFHTQSAYVVKAFRCLIDANNTGILFTYMYVSLLYTSLRCRGLHLVMWQVEDGEYFRIVMSYTIF